MNKKYIWHPMYNIVLAIKNDYINRFNKLDTINLKEWIVRLNKKEYNDIFECLQINQYNEFVLIRYGLAEMQEGMWTDPTSIYRECRSVVIDVIDEELVLTPFRKFFNLNEIEENKIDEINKELNNAKSIEITNKLDGSMQNARWYKNRIFMSGSMALDISESWRLADGYKKLTNNHKIMIKENPYYTFIFEYISLQDAHVVMYKKEQEGMYLLGMRNTHTGEQLSYNQVRNIANNYNIPMVNIEDINFEQIIKDCKKYKSHEKEGWVINIDGHMIKLKCDDYVQLHKIIDKISSVNVIIKNIADETFDDLISKVPENYKKRVNGIAKIIYAYIEEVNEKVKKYYTEAPKQTRKDFMIWVDQYVPKNIRVYVKNEYMKNMWNALKTNTGNTARYKKFNDIVPNKTYVEIFQEMSDV